MHVRLSSVPHRTVTQISTCSVSKSGPAEKRLNPTASAQRNLPTALILADMAELVTRPLDAVRQLFQQTGGSQAGDWGVRAAFEVALADPAVLAQVQTVLCADAWSGNLTIFQGPCTAHFACADALCRSCISAIHLHQYHASDCGRSC